MPEQITSKPPPAPSSAGVWSLRVATVASIPIRLHFTFLLFLVYIALSGRGLLSVALVLVLFLCVVLHELGHSVVAVRSGIPVVDITLYPIGGVARIEKRPLPFQELLIAAAGPAVNLVIAAVLAGVLLGTGGFLSAAVTHIGGGGWRGFVEVVMQVNVTLFLVNLIPASPMDGGRVLRALIALYLPMERATAIAANVGQFLAITAGFFAFFSHPPNWLLIFIALFVYIGAGQEAQVTRQSALLDHVFVREAMITDVRTLSVGATLKEAADVLLATSQHDFPVVHGDEVQGVLTRNGLLRGLSALGPTAYVAGVMDRKFASVKADDNLAEVLPQLQSHSGPLIVLEGETPGKLLGIVTAENVQEFFAVRQIAAAQSSRNVETPIRPQ